MRTFLTLLLFGLSHPLFAGPSGVGGGIGTAYTVSREARAQIYRESLGDVVGGGGGMMAVNISDTVIIQKEDISDIRLKNESIIPAEEFMKRYRKQQKKDIMQFNTHPESPAKDIQLKDGRIIDLDKLKGVNPGSGGGGI